MPIYKPSSSAIFRQVDDFMIALNLECGKYFTMNEVASRMWAVLTAMNSVEETAAAIMAEYEVVADEVHKDLGQLIADLEANDLAAFM